VVLGEGTIKLGLQHGGVLPGLVEFLLQRFRPEHNVTIITWVLNSGGTRLLKGTITYLHPLLNPAHRLQVAGHRHRVGEVIC
jgi:hypothetical protein